MNAYKELTAWISRNQKQFREGKYSIEDIVKLAIACGFDPKAIAQWRAQRTFRKVG